MRAATAPKTLKDREDEDIVKKIYQENKKLQKQLDASVEKQNKLIDQIKKKDRDLALARRHTPTVKQGLENRPSTAPPVDVIAAPNILSTKGGLDTIATDKNKLLELARKLKAR